MFQRARPALKRNHRLFLLHEGYTVSLLIPFKQLLTEYVNAPDEVPAIIPLFPF